MAKWLLGRVRSLRWSPRPGRVDQRFFSRAVYAGIVIRPLNKLFIKLFIHSSEYHYSRSIAAFITTRLAVLFSGLPARAAQGSVALDTSALAGAVGTKLTAVGVRAEYWALKALSAYEVGILALAAYHFSRGNALLTVAAWVVAHFSRSSSCIGVGSAVSRCLQGERSFRGSLVSEDIGLLRRTLLHRVGRHYQRQVLG